MSQITRYILSGPGGLTIDTINHIPPDGTGNFTIAAGTGIAITPGTNTITISTNGTGIVTLTSNSGVATEALGNINVFGGHDINTNASGSTLNVALNNAITIGDLSSIIGSPALTVTTGDINVVAGNIDLPTTNSAGTEGIIYKGSLSQTWLHNFGTRNFFAGLLTGNLTLTTATATDNVAVGDGALDDLTTGNQNCAFGVGVMDHVTTSSDNCAFGFHSLNQLEEGGGGPFNSNAAFGTFAGFGLTSGSQNSFFGINCGDNVVTGSNNIAIGYLAGSNYDAAESSNIAIGNLGVATESNVIRIGTQGSGAGQQNECFIAGITGVSVSNTQSVVLDTTTGQLGAHVMPGPSMGTYVSVNHAASPYTVLTTDYYISCNVTAGVITVLLPNAPLTTSVFAIKDQVGLAATSNITVTTVGGAVTIDGVTSFVMNTAYEAISVIFNGTSYEIF